MPVDRSVFQADVATIMTESAPPTNITPTDAKTLLNELSDSIPMNVGDAPVKLAIVNMFRSMYGY